MNTTGIKTVSSKVLKIVEEEPPNMISSYRYEPNIC